MLDTLIRLAKPASSRRDSGNAIGPLFLIGINKTKMGRVFVFRRPAEAMDVGLEGGLGLVLSDGSPDVLLDPRRWPDLNCNLMNLDRMMTQECSGSGFGIPFLIVQR